MPLETIEDLDRTDDQFSVFVFEVQIGYASHLREVLAVLADERDFAARSSSARSDHRISTGFGIEVFGADLTVRLDPSICDVGLALAQRLDQLRLFCGIDEHLVLFYAEQHGNPAPVSRQHHWTTGLRCVLDDFSGVPFEFGDGPKILANLQIGHHYPHNLG